MKAFKRSSVPPGTLVKPCCHWSVGLWPIPDWEGRPVGRLSSEHINIILDTRWVSEKNHRWFLIMNHKGEVGWVFPTSVTLHQR